MKQGIKPNGSGQGPIAGFCDEINEHLNFTAADNIPIRRITNLINVTSRPKKQHKIHGKTQLSVQEDFI